MVRPTCNLSAFPQAGKKGGDYFSGGALKVDQHDQDTFLEPSDGLSPDNGYIENIFIPDGACDKRKMPSEATGALKAGDDIMMQTDDLSSFAAFHPKTKNHPKTKSCTVKK